MSKRIKKVFSDNKKKLVTFVTGGDPDKETSQKILKKIVSNGSDIILHSFFRYRRIYFKG